MLHQSDIRMFPISVPAWLCNFLMAASSAPDRDGMGKRTRQMRVKKKWEGGKLERGEGLEVSGRGSPASLCQGFPPSHQGCVDPRLAKAHS